MITPIFFHRFTSEFGTFSLTWLRTESGPVVQRIYLPHDAVPAELAEVKSVPSQREVHPEINKLCEKILGALAGERVDFDSALFAMETCTPFQRNVLQAEFGIPRGYVSTYGRIARYLGVPGGARAVGGALANNPFPICIPCHRAVRAGGALGGFRGGLAMKRILLQREGVRFTKKGVVILEKVYY